MYRFHNITNAVGVDGIMNEFTVALGLDDTKPFAGWPGAGKQQTAPAEVGYRVP